MRATAFIMGLLAIVAAGASATTHAEPVSNSVSVRVKTAGIDLRTPQGQAELKSRIVAAAMDVCGEPSASDPSSRRAVRACRDDVARGAQQEAALRMSKDRLAAR